MSAQVRPSCPAPRLCELVKGCTEPHYAKGGCYRHYRNMRDGRPLEAPRRTHRTRVTPRRYV